ncbi:hypothetical protein Rhe02_02140 [Rhizocola hellebori]|uniref:Uncharacterized protein n=1 Tax=Rhizocola hellebori TaxID=1392758 RepID=A0A8J3Q2A0_9ACTN|nr:YndJ family protein [Rhizocola hellebori]GIH02147.1 hypothetical protein Rhe02_02140 [Rhizocola hellebori]
MMGHGLAPWAHMVLNAVVALGMLAIVPLGLKLTGRFSWWWYAAAVPGAVALWLPRGGFSATLAVGYAIGTVCLIWLVPRVFTIANVATATAYGCLSVASFSLVAERSGYHMMGFELDVLSLTVAHFHYAGFAAALIAGLLTTASENPWGTAASLSVPVGTAVVLVGYFLGDAVELAGAVILTAGMWMVAWLIWRQLRIVLPALLLGGTMLLAVDWAAGHVFAVPHLSVSWMVATHGLANAIGFALCTLLALRKALQLGVSRPHLPAGPMVCHAFQHVEPGKGR